MAADSDTRWSPNGAELFYVAADQWLKSVTIPFVAGGASSVRVVGEM